MTRHATNHPMNLPLHFLGKRRNGCLWDFRLPLNISRSSQPGFQISGEAAVAFSSASRPTIVRNGAISSGTFKQHFESLQIVIHGLCRDLTNQRMSESYDILFCDLADGFIRALTEKLQKLPETSLIEVHGR